MLSQSEQLTRDLKDTQTAKQKDSSHVYDDLLKLQEEKNPQQLRGALVAATQGLQSQGLLPNVTISMGANGSEAANDALATSETTNVQDGHLFSAVGDLLTALKAGSAEALPMGESKIAFPSGATLDVIRDASGLSKMTWQDGTTWEKSGDEHWVIKDAQGKSINTFDGTVNLDATTHVLSVNDKSGIDHSLKPDGTRVMSVDGQVIELDYSNDASLRFQYDSNKQITKLTEADGNIWVRDDKGVFNEYDQQGHKTNRSNDSTLSVDLDGTCTMTSNKDKSMTVVYTDGSKLHDDSNGNVTAYKYADGTTVDYHYTNGLIDSVKDRDNTNWKRDDSGLFHQYDGSGNITGATAAGSKFIPPTTATNLYENSRSGILDKLVGALEFGASGLAPVGLAVLAGQAAGVDLNAPNTPIRAEDVSQGDLGDCYFLSAVSSVSAQEPDAIRKMIQDNHDGTYTVTFPGRPDKPIKIQAPTQDELDRFAHYQDGTYAAVLEKANRYLTGKTDNDDGGFPADALTLLTGKTFHYDYIHESKLGFTNLGTSDDELAQKLTRASDNHEEITAATYPDKGPVKNHTFTVLGYEPSTKTVILRNPWGTLGFDRQNFPSVIDLGGGKFTMSLEEFHDNYQWLATLDD